MERKKRTRRDILEKAIPDLFGNKKIEVKRNYVVFPVPAEVHKQVRKWLTNGDALAVAIANQDKELRLAIINEKEQRLLETNNHKRSL
ncbi:MAG: hypothetical protein QXD19_03865 [Candidatus Bathyarchaeia archaeon]